MSKDKFGRVQEESEAPPTTVFPRFKGAFNEKRLRVIRPSLASPAGQGPLSGVPCGMDKDKVKADRPRSGSLTEGRGTPARNRRSSTSTTQELQDEESRMARLAATAADKAAAHQRKMTDYVSRSRTPSPVGAGELGSGPRDPAAAASPAAKSPRNTSSTQQQQHKKKVPSEEEEEMDTGIAKEKPSRPTTEDVNRLLQESRRQRSAVQVIQAIHACTSAISGAPAAPKDVGAAGGAAGVAEDGAGEDGDGWQVWSNRKNRRIGADLGKEEERGIRGSTPFKLPGAELHNRRGYYTSTYRRNQAQLDSRSSKPTMVARLTELQWTWFRMKVCLGCGKDHQVKDCRRISREEGKALLKAAWSCPEDMRPWNRDRAAPRTSRPPPPASAATAAATSAPTAAAAPASAAAAASASAAAPAAAATPSTSTKRNRESEKTGLTPEAKKAKMFSEMVKSSLILYVREKDGAPLSKDRFNALKLSFTYFVEDMLAKNKDPPMCSGRWQESRSVVRIPMASEEDLLWMRCFLDKSYLVQNEDEFKQSKNRIYVSFLRDRMEPELTGMRQDKLSSFIRFYRRQAGIGTLFELKMAAKTNRGKAVHLVMDEEAESIFVQRGSKIPFPAAGWIKFEERSAYVARIKAMERDRLRPRASNLEQGQAQQAVENLRISSDPAIEVVELEEEEQDKTTEATTETETTSSSDKKEPSEEAKALARSLLRAVRDEDMDREAAESRMLEKFGMSLEDAMPKRSTSNSSWSEEVEHMHKLSQVVVPEVVVEEEISMNDDDVRDQALFELRQERKAQDAGHRAAGSGQATEGAAGSPSS